MKIKEAILRVDALVFNTCTAEEKVRWLSKLDALIYRNVLQTHAGEPAEFSGYSTDTDPQTQLLVPAPYDTVYLRWLEAQIYYETGEFTRYNNAITLFNNAYEGYKKHYTRTHMPLSRGNRFIF